MKFESICHQIVPQNDQEHFMKEALKEAERAYIQGEVPVGAVLVFQGEIVAKGRNQVELLKDATAHAEMICLSAGSAHVENWRLKGATLYCTLEPCAMCTGAMLLSRLDKLVYGAPDLRHGACGSWVNLLEKKHPTHTLEVEGGVLKAYASHLMQDFFSKRREK